MQTINKCVNVIYTEPNDYFSFFFRFLLHSPSLLLLIGFVLASAFTACSNSGVVFGSLICFLGVFFTIVPSTGSAPYRVST